MRASIACLTLPWLSSRSLIFSVPAPGGLSAVAISGLERRNPLKLIDQHEEYGPVRAPGIVKTDALQTSCTQTLTGFAAR